MEIDATNFSITLSDGLRLRVVKGDVDLMQDGALIMRYAKGVCDVWEAGGGQSVVRRTPDGKIHYYDGMEELEPPRAKDEPWARLEPGMKVRRGPLGKLETVRFVHRSTRREANNWAVESKTVDDVVFLTPDQLRNEWRIVEGDDNAC